MRIILKRGLVPVKISALNKMIKSFKEKTDIPPNDSWLHKVGRKPIMTDNDIETVIDDVVRVKGKAIGLKEISKLLVESSKDKVRNTGCVPLSDIQKPSTNTIKNYRALIASNDRIKVTNETIGKTDARYSAENSLMSAMALVVLVASTHYYVIPQEIAQVRNDMKTASDGVRMLYNVVSKAHGNVPVAPLKPQYIMSTDDTVVYTYEGADEDGHDNYRLVANNSLETKGTYSNYHMDTSASMCGLRVKLTFTFTATGSCAPIFVSVCGLSEREMPSDPSVVLEVEGLCVGGGGVSMNNKKGCVMFMRGDSGAEKCRYNYYRDKVFLPFVNNMRLKYDGFDSNSGTVIPENLTVASWCDGDLGQIASIVNDFGTYNRNRIIANKQNAARSGMEQPADVCKVFPIIKKLQKKYTVKHFEDDIHPMKRSVKSSFAQLYNQNKVCLKSSKKNSLVDFISSVPEIVTRAVSKENCRSGFVATGFVDSKFKKYPDFDCLLATCRTSPKIVDYERCKTHFEELFHKCHEEGHVSDADFERLGFPQDHNCNGNIQVHLAGIS